MYSCTSDVRLAIVILSTMFFLIVLNFKEHFFSDFMKTIQYYLISFYYKHKYVDQDVWSFHVFGLNAGSTLPYACSWNYSNT